MAVESPVAPSPANLDLARGWIAEMKTNRRGPYAGVLWYCEDGTVLPPKMSACAPHGGGVQHGVLSEQAKKLGALGLHVGTVLASLADDELAGDDYYRSRALIVETYLERTLDGWVLQEAKTYRGFRQIEDEQSAAERLLAHLAADERTLTDHRLLLSRLFWAVPIDVGGKAADEIRRLAGELGDADPKAFGNLRFKIHAVPDPNDIVAITDYVAARSDPLAEKAALLASKMRDFYSPAGLRQRLAALRRQVRNEEVGAQIDAFLAIEANELVALFGGGSELIRAADRALVPGPTRQHGINNRRLLHVAYLVETLWLGLANSIARQPLSRSEALIICRELLTASTALGWLSVSEMKQLVDTVEHMEVGLTDTYDAGLGELMRTDELAAARLHEQLAPALARYALVETAATGVLDGQLRHSLLRPLGIVINRLHADLTDVRRGGHEVRGLPEPSTGELRGEVPGSAVGPLCPTPADTAPACGDSTAILLLRQLPPVLPSAAGLLLDSRWCEPTHLALVARERGVVLACASEGLLRGIERFAGREFLLGVSAQGRVLLGPAGAFPDLRQRKTGAPGDEAIDMVRLRARVASLDSGTELPELWLEMSAELP